MRIEGDGWESRIAPCLKSFLEERRMCGYKFEGQEAQLRQFDRYCAENDIGIEGLTTAAMARYNDRNPYESIDTRHSRLLLLRQFADYMNRTRRIPEKV
ncbi:hypothetical protein JZU54_08150 [bacterium]|nr:hypothetical protein [bacterium]